MHVLIIALDLAEPCHWAPCSDSFSMTKIGSQGRCVEQDVKPKCISEKSFWVGRQNEAEPRSRAGKWSQIAISFVVFLGFFLVSGESRWEAAQFKQWTYDCERFMDFFVFFFCQETALIDFLALGKVMFGRQSITDHWSKGNFQLGPLA